ncbi:MAG TPA: hypothetical protein VGP72_11500 [Planctomycetota bacterium]|jgi:O-glycosyl hydrolase
MMGHVRRVLVFVLTAWAGLCFAADGQNRFDAAGRLQQIGLGKGWMPLNSDVRVPTKGWKKILAFSGAKPAANLSGEIKKWHGEINEGSTAGVQIEQTAREEAGKLIIQVRATAKIDSDIEGVIFWLEAPADLFAGGSYKLADKSGELPVELPQEYRLCSAVTDNVSLSSKKGPELNIGLSPAVSVLIQDGRKWSQTFAILAHLHSGKMTAQQSASLTITLSTRGDVESTPAQLTLDASTPRYSVTGIGGTYCFNIESPVTRFTLDNLKVAYARTEMTLENWMPEADNGGPEKIDWPKLVAKDVAGSRLHRELELMRELSQKKIPFIASVWKLPAWLYTRPPDERNMNNRIGEDKYALMLKCIASYLLYAKEKYQVEPDYFSFNEPNIGCRVLFNADEHCEFIKQMGRVLAKHKLKTKLLLGDVAGPRNTVSYCAPGAADAEALQYIGAISFHSWGGATPAQYGAWAELGQKLKLPVLVAEAGPDPSAWQGGVYQSFEYGMREVVHYQELFLHAKPQAVLLWEYTGDYSLLGTSKFDKNKLTMTERFCFQKHWCDFILAGSEGLQSSSDNANVLFTAFRHKTAGSAGATGLTLHVANTRWARPAVLQGIPAQFKTLNVVRTSRGEMFRKLEPVEVKDGKVTIELPGQSLTTLTTLAIPELKAP